MQLTISSIVNTGDGIGGTGTNKDDDETCGESDDDDDDDDNNGSLDS
jgi:hypothetical protein